MKIQYAFYFIFTTLNVWVLKWASHGPLFSFMTFRGLTSIILVILISRIQGARFHELNLKTNSYRLGLGGAGLGLQLTAAQFLPVSALAFTTRSLPVWLTLFTPSRYHKKMGAILFIIILILILFFNNGYLAIIALFSPVLLALSQIKQARAAQTEPSVFLPLAPGVGLFLIGVIGFTFSEEVFNMHSLKTSILSGAVMSVTYWLSVPIFKKKGVRTVGQIDIASSLFFVFIGIWDFGFFYALPLFLLGVISFYLLR